MSQTPSYFELFGVPARYNLDLTALGERYRELQRVYHPDRHAGKSPQEIRHAVQKASWVNQAYDVLKSPVARAQYLLELQGVSIDGHGHITRDGEFLMQQMEMREQLQEVESAADPFAALAALTVSATDAFAALQADFNTALDSGNRDLAVETVAKMQFFAKFLHDIEDMEERLDA